MLRSAEQEAAGNGRVGDRDTERERERGNDFEVSLSHSGKVKLAHVKVHRTKMDRREAREQK